MTLENSSNTKDSNWLPILGTLIPSILLLIFSSIGWLSGLKSLLSYIVDPIYTTSTNIASGVEQYVDTLCNISDFRTQYNDMKIELAQYEIDILDYNNLKIENEDLKKQLELQNIEYRYVQSKILDHIETDYIIINRGNQDGASKGDIAVIGNTYIGTIIESNEYTSKIRLPISKSSFLEAYVISSNDDSNRNILSRAVVSGSSDGIKIENIGMNSGVKNGDTVIINDSKVGDNLILGNIVGLSEDPASTTRTGYVSPTIDYYDLINIFVRLKNVD
jgi:rod shape-determining protein MreC